MARRGKKTVVFVHGWSVSHTETYGGLPERLLAEAAGAGIELSIRQIFLGRYVSFRDEVQVGDIARAFEAAVTRELGDVGAAGFACITHSTGGPVVREWWRRYHSTRGRRCPMRQLVMLAPANFGSALAQLGSSRLSRVNNWFEGMEPGTGVLDWLELGSPESWELNLDWIRAGAGRIGARGVFPFVLTGQTIDRKMYDHLVPLTAELGSDGVVRVASANLSAGYLRLEQEVPRALRGRRGAYQAPVLALTEHASGPRIPLRIVSGRSHSGPARGIQRSVSKVRGHGKGAETVAAILACLGVRDRRGYAALADRFERATAEIQNTERVERDSRVLRDAIFIHDRFSMVVVRVQDETGLPVEDCDLLFTGGKQHDPNHLPRGFLAHAQRNRRHPGTTTYFFNHDVMTGCEAVLWRDRVVREPQAGAGRLGLVLRPRPEAGFVHYLPCDVQASSELLATMLRPNQTTLVDVVLRRVVREGVFRLDRGTTRRSFKNDPAGPPIGLKGPEAVANRRRLD